MGSRTENRTRFLELLSNTGKNTVTKSEIIEICNYNNIVVPQWFINNASNRIGHGVYRVPSSSTTIEAKVVPMVKPVEHSEHRIVNVSTELEEANLIPEVYKNYVPFGNFDDVYSIVTSGKFFPVLLSGPSGNGKTISIEQACAKAKREFICVSMTPQTDESDLFGNYVLINGQMEWRDGPVTTACRKGAVLVIDELDYGADNLSCLQRVLEGKPFLLKKKGEMITPSFGFNIFATANTKGKGSEDGRYMYTNVLNESFLERFINTFEQTWPSVAVEKKIIRKELNTVDMTDDDFAEKLITWANIIRKTFDEGGCDEVISTRRLVHIVRTYGIFGDKMKAIAFCLNRFDPDTKASFADLYTKVDAGASETVAQPTAIPNPDVLSEIQTV